MNTVTTNIETTSFGIDGKALDAQVSMDEVVALRFTELSVVGGGTMVIW